MKALDAQAQDWTLSCRVTWMDAAKSDWAGRRGDDVWKCPPGRDKVPVPVWSCLGLERSQASHNVALLTRQLAGPRTCHPVDRLVCIPEVPDLWTCKLQTFLDRSKPCIWVFLCFTVYICVKGERGLLCQTYWRILGTNISQNGILS